MDTARTEAKTRQTLAQRRAARILDQARLCFERNGILKTTMEEIAVAAGVTRQTVHNHFGNKQDLIDSITLIEIARIQETLINRLSRQDSFAGRITEIVTVSVQAAIDNPYIRRIVEDMAAPHHEEREGDRIQAWQRERWSATLAHARQSGELADDLDDRRIVAWLSFCQTMLLIMMENGPAMTDADLRHFVRRLVVAPLLGGPASELEKLRRENAALRQALAKRRGDEEII